MAKFNRFLIIVITILALAAAVMSYFLFERRNEFRNRATDLSKTVANIVQYLDAESGTQLRQKITFNPAVSEEDIPESGALSWKNYHLNPEQYKALLKQAEELAQKVNTHKNFLAENFAKVGFDLGIPLEELSMKTFKETASPEDYKLATERILSLAQAMEERSNALIQTLENTSNVVEYSFNADKLEERIEDTTKEGQTIARGFKYEDPLDGYKEAIIDLNTRCSDYASALVKITENISAHDWDVSIEKLKNKDDYGPALTSLQKDASNVNSKLVELKQKKKELAQVKKERSKLRTDLEKIIKDKNTLKEVKNELNSKVDQLKQRLKEAGQAGQESEEINLKPGAKVVQVNQKWNYVIVNAGYDQLQEGVTLVVSRNGKFIAQVKVTKVTPTISVADILPETQRGEIQENDQIHMSSTMKD